jgi:hypothetical protein
MQIEIYRHPGTPRGVPTYTAIESTVEARIDPEAASNVVVREVFTGLTAITDDGEVLVFTMRDSGFECIYECGDVIKQFSLQQGEIVCPGQ